MLSQYGSPCTGCPVLARPRGDFRGDRPEGRRQPVPDRLERRPAIPIFATCRPMTSVVYTAGRRRRRRRAVSVGRGRLSTDAQIANREAARPYSVIPFLLPPPKNPCPTRAERASQAGRRRFDPGRPVSSEPGRRQRVPLPEGSGWSLGTERVPGGFRVGASHRSSRFAALEFTTPRNASVAPSGWRPDTRTPRRTPPSLRPPR